MIRKLLSRVFSRKTSAPVSPTRSSSAGPRIIRTRAARDHARSHQFLCAESDIRLAGGGIFRFRCRRCGAGPAFGLEPKDYDVATNATPEEVRAIFRRSRIIGRRFRLVHVMCGAETVEVSTFRGGTSAGEDEGITADTHADEHGRLLRDNIFGSQEEDAKRRDFTVNALFFDPVHEEIWDYLNGDEDIQARRLRIIGDPVRRFREDPVRMLRVVGSKPSSICRSTHLPPSLSGTLRPCCRMCRRRVCLTKC